MNLIPLKTAKNHFINRPDQLRNPANPHIVSAAMKQLLLCVLALLVFSAGLWLALEQGRMLQSPAPAVPEQTAPAAGGIAGMEPSASLVDNLRENLQQPLTRLFIQFILIIVAARLCGTLALKFRQPAVVGEMIAGILLGPSLLGWLNPHFFQFIFPAPSLDTLRLFSQIGVCLFMFVVGMELDVSQLKHQARTAVMVSQVSILFPYLLGVVSALFLFSTFAGPTTTFAVFALFIGISMSITAFPVLARILDERGLTKSPLGVTALICAAMNDVTAWCILALVVAIAKAKSMSSAGLSIGLVVAFVLAMLFWIKPAPAAPAQPRGERRGQSRRKA